MGNGRRSSILNPETATDWHRRVARGYEASGEADHWTRAREAGWTAAERVLVRRYLRTPSRVLVVGSGGGRELVALQAHGDVGVGIEVARRLLVEYREGRSSSASAVLLADMAALPFLSRTFDAVLLFNQVVGHSATRTDRVATIAESLRVVRAGCPVLLSFYVGAVEDYSLWLGAWSSWSRRRRNAKEEPSTPGLAPPVRVNPLRRRVREWVRGKEDRTRRALHRTLSGRRSRDGGGDDIVLVPSGRFADRSPGTVPFHLYRLGEFFEDVRVAGGRVAFWRSNAELNAALSAPLFLRGLDHLHFCAVVGDGGTVRGSEM